jgi:hypothetical protein
VVALAGKLKPDDSLLTYKKEAKCEILEHGNGFYGETSPMGLLDGEAYAGYTDSNVCYFYEYDDTKAYFKFKVYSKCNIWAISTDGNFGRIPTLKLCDKYKKDISDVYLNQKESDYITGKWTKMILELPPGEYYLFNNNSRAVIGEWYCESVLSPFIVKNNDDFFIVNEENYDAETNKYIPVTSYDFDNLSTDSLLDTPEYLNGLRPIDLFDGDIQLIKASNVGVAISGIKSDKELVVATGDINKGLASTINSITIESTKTNNGDLRLALSVDNGKTWKTYDGANWVDLPVTIPSNKYSSMTVDEIKQWNNARDIIATHGMDKSTFNFIDFNTLTDNNTAPEYIRFAYVLIRPIYTDDVKTTKLDWDFNAKGNMDLMVPGTEYSISLYEKEARFKSLIDNDLIKVNFLI